MNSRKQNERSQVANVIKLSKERRKEDARSKRIFFFSNSSDEESSKRDGKQPQGKGLRGQRGNVKLSYKRIQRKTKRIVEEKSGRF